MYELCLSSKDRKAVFKLSLVLPYMWKMTPRSHNEENSLIIEYCYWTVIWYKQIPEQEKDEMVYL